MNEPANFCNGECNWTRVMPDDEPNKDYLVDEIDFPYQPGGINLETKTLPPHLKHANGALHKDVHNLYGFMDSWATHTGQKSIG